MLTAGRAVALCYDTGNCYYYGGAEPGEDLRACAAHVRHMHMKDKAGAYDEWNFPALGDGYADLKGALALAGPSKGTTLSMEIEFTPAGVGPAETEEAVCRSARYLCNLLQGMQ